MYADITPVNNCVFFEKTLNYYIFRKISNEILGYLGDQK